MDTCHRKRVIQTKWNDELFKAEQVFRGFFIFHNPGENTWEDFIELVREVGKSINVRHEVGHGYNSIGSWREKEVGENPYVNDIGYDDQFGSKGAYIVAKPQYLYSVYKLYQNRMPNNLMVPGTNYMHDEMRSILYVKLIVVQSTLDGELLA